MPDYAQNIPGRFQGELVIVVPGQRPMTRMGLPFHSLGPFERCSIVHVTYSKCMPQVFLT